MWYFPLSSIMIDLVALAKVTISFMICSSVEVVKLSIRASHLLRNCLCSSCTALLIVRWARVTLSQVSRSSSRGLSYSVFSLSIQLRGTWCCSRLSHKRDFLRVSKNDLKSHSYT